MLDKEKAQKYNNVKYMIASIGAGAAIGDIAYGVWDYHTPSVDMAIPVFTIGIISALVTGFALMKRNPYEDLEAKFREQEEAKVKKLIAKRDKNK